MAGIEEQAAAVVAAHPFGKPSAVKRGRCPRWPYVPIVDFGQQATGVHRTRTEQIMDRAFATREEAVAFAESVIARRRALLLDQLLTPRYRALREQHGLPRELPA